MPNRQWFSGTFVAVGTVATAYVVAGRFTHTVDIAIIGLIVQRAVSYFTPNSPADFPTETPSGP